MPIFTGCIPEGIATCVIFDEGGYYSAHVWNCFGMFALTGDGMFSAPALQMVISRLRLAGFVLEEV